MANTITFLLRNDAETLTVYPFAFEFRVRYTLFENSLAVAYEVVNPAKELMYFSVGAHPAFKIPLVAGTDYTDYYLQFNQVETAPRWPISPDGLIEQTPIAAVTKYQPAEPVERPVSKRCAGAERYGFFDSNPGFR